MGFNSRYKTGKHYNRRKILLKAQILQAQQETLSGTQAARWLGVTYTTYKRYAKIYGIFEQHRSTGKNIPKTKYKRNNETGLLDILEGKYPNYSILKFKRRLISSGILMNSCALCGFGEQHVEDGSVPLVLYFIDGDRHNLRKENIQLRCYNCTYLTTGKSTGRRYDQFIAQKEAPKEAISEPQPLSEEEMLTLRSELFNN